MIAAREHVAGEEPERAMEGVGQRVQCTCGGSE